LELTPEEANEKSRYKKIVADGTAIDELMVAVFIASMKSGEKIKPRDVLSNNPIHSGSR